MTKNLKALKRADAKAEKKVKPTATKVSKALKSMK
jgi:hypothetical protein